MGLPAAFLRSPSPGGDVADNRLAALIDRDMLHPDGLLAYGHERE